MNRRRGWAIGEKGVDQLDGIDRMRLQLYFTSFLLFCINDRRHQTRRQPLGA
jgi:hypothetical protein